MGKIEKKRIQSSEARGKKETGESNCPCQESQKEILTKTKHVMKEKKEATRNITYMSVTSSTGRRRVKQPRITA